MMNKKKKSMSRKEKVSGKDPGKKLDMFEKLTTRVTKTKRRTAHIKVEKWTKRSFLIHGAVGNHFKVLLKAMKESSEETSFSKNDWLLYGKLNREESVRRLGSNTNY